MNNLLRPRIWPSFLASSGVGPCDVPFRYASESRGTAGRLPGGTSIFAVSRQQFMEISGLRLSSTDELINKRMKVTKSANKGAEISRQVVLPFMKSLEISLKSIRVRFFRSMITTMSLVLAVSFLCFVRVGTDTANGLLQTQDPTYRQALVRAGYDLEPGATSTEAVPRSAG